MLKQALPIIALISILTFAYWLNYAAPQEAVGQECKMQHGNCALTFRDHTFTIQINPLPLEIEEPLMVTYSYPNNFRLTSTWVEGHNMFMGKMKIVPEKATNHAQFVTQSGRLFLGSCSQPQMVWKLVTEFQDLETLDTFYLYYYFETSIS